MNERIKIIYTEDQDFLRETLNKMLKEEGIDIIGEAADGVALLNLLKRVTPDLILLDLEMDGMNGNDALAILKVKYPNLKIIVFTSYTDEWLKADFKSKGVNAFLSKTSEFKSLVYLIRRVHNSDDFNNFGTQGKSIFTKRDIQTIPLFLAGKNSKQIAERLNITEKAVEAIRNRLFEKTKSKNAVDLARQLTKAGFEFLGIKDSNI